MSWRRSATYWGSGPWSTGRKVWAQIVPTSGRGAPQAGEVEPMEVTHRVVVRSSALPELRNGLRFTFRGQWYEVLYGYPIYNRTGWLELFVRLVVDDRVPGV